MRTWMDNVVWEQIGFTVQLFSLFT
jgi:hypothetical protein